MNILGKLGHLLGAALMICAAAHAQTYPAKPVTVVVPFPPGGSSDVIARLLNAKLTDAFKQNFLTDNRPARAR
jgi:tripartite-type tricarboxylate transporter receptor subunit TctC